MVDSNQKYSAQKLMVIKHIFSTLKKISLYHFKHPSVNSSIQETYCDIHSILSKINELTIMSAEDNVLVGGVFMDKNHPSYQEIKAIFHKLSIENITLYAGISIKELEFFFRLLLAKKESVEKKGGTTAILKSVGAKHLKVNQFKYEKMADGQTIVDETDPYEISDQLQEEIFDVEKTDKNDPQDFKDILKEKIKDLVDSPEELESLYSFLIDKFTREVDARITEETKELVSKNKKITFEKNRTDSVIKSISDGLVVVDNQGKILMMNPAAEKMFDNSQESMVGGNIMDNTRDEHMISLAKDPYKEDEDETLVKEIEIGGEEETQKTIRSSTAVVENEDGKTVGMVSILTDVTKQKEIERMKSDFLSNVSHELRTPLAAIKQTVSLLLGGTTGTINDIQKNFLSIAKKSLERLGRLIDDLLDLSKLEAGKMELAPKLADINTVIEEAIYSLKQWTESKEITLEKNITTQIPEFLFDPDRITQALINLTSNAIKFSPNKGVITISACTDSNPEFSTKKMVKLSVKDTGIGIPPESLGKVFEKFKQVGGDQTTDIKGTGLGLPITKEIITLHQGNIWVESEEGKGSEFIFTLPVEQKDPTASRDKIPE